MEFEKLKEEDSESVDYGFNRVTSRRISNDQYTMYYRILKTVLLIFTMISFGFNFELIGPTLEDLKIFLNVNYSSISFALVLRNIGYLSVTILLGLTINRILKYSELCMAISSAIVFASWIFLHRKSIKIIFNF